jgi:hypothetical protein
MKKILFIILNFTFIIGQSQIYNKWYQTKFIYNNSVNDSYFSQVLFPVEFEITTEQITVYDPLNKDNFSTYDTKSNMFSDGIRLFNTSGSSYKYGIDSVSKNKLILSTPGAKIYYYRIISHDYKSGLIKLIGDADTIIKFVIVLPEFKEKFTSFLVKNLNLSKYSDSCSRLINTSFIIHNTGLIDSIEIQENDTAIKNEITRFLLTTNGKWKINKKFKNYHENKISLSLMIMSDFTMALVKKNKNISAARQLYIEGCNLYNQKAYNKALYYFNESILFSEYSYSLKDLNQLSPNDHFVNVDYNDAIMNRAATYYQLNQIDNACLDWEKILTNRPKIPKDFDEAKDNIRKICK